MMSVSVLSVHENKSGHPQGVNKGFFSFDAFNGFDFLVLGICLISFVCSIIEARVNVDNLHWGWAYIAALDLKRGAIPHSEVIIFYGYIYTWIQSISLMLFGERLVSLGIVTGLFYSVSLFLSYRIFLRLMKRGLACLSVLLIFLIHPYAIYPAPNYYMYMFELLALVYFLKYSESKYYGLLAGFFLSMSVLARYSSVIAVVPPFAVLLCAEYFVTPEKKKFVMEKIGLISAGFFIPLLAFFAYLFLHSALDDFFLQNTTIVRFIGEGDNVNTYLSFLIFLLQMENSLASDLRGKIFTPVLLVCLFFAIKEIRQYVFSRLREPAYKDGALFAACLIAVFGYLNSIHVYETFRLVNGASLGIGVCVLAAGYCFDKVGKPLKYLIPAAGLIVAAVLLSTLFFKQTTSAYYPWQRDVLFGRGIQNSSVPILKGKILTKEYNSFYEEVFDVIKPYKKCCYIVNYTRDVVAFVMNDLPRVQISPVPIPGVDDISRQVQSIEEKKAVILSFKKLEIPGYVTVFAKPWPAEIPWMGGGYFFIFAPERLTTDHEIYPDKEEK